MCCSLRHEAPAHEHMNGILQKYAPTDICTNPARRRQKHILMFLYILMTFCGTQRCCTENEGVLRDLKTLELLMLTTYVCTIRPSI